MVYMNKIRDYYDNILIGGSGFIGSALSERLAARGETVLNISRDAGEQHPGVDTILLDVSDHKSLSESFPRGKNVFILIGQNSSRFNIDEELSNLDNIIKVLNVTKPEKVLYLSSVLVYGERTMPAQEEDKANPIEQYSFFKNVAQQQLQHHLDLDIPLAILCLANVYGNPKNRGFTDFIMRSVLGNKTDHISINGDGTQERDYIFIDDVVSAILAVRDKLAGNDVVNIATGVSHSLIELVEHISSIADKSLPYEINGAKIHEVMKSRIANTKLRERYGFKPSYSFDEGLRETLRRYETADLATPSPKSNPVLLQQRIILMGGEGFIGRNLSTYFSKHNTCFSIGKEESNFPQRHDTFLQADLYRTDRAFLSKSFSAAQPSFAVIHLIDNKVPIEDLLEHEALLAENTILQPDTHLVLFSSSVIYANPDSEYGVRKKILEDFYTHYCARKGIPLTILRLFNTFGPYQLPYRKGSLVGNLIYNYLTHRVTEITNMEIERDFIYSQDIAKFVEYVLLHKLEGVFDVGSGKLTSVKNLVSLLENSVLQDKIEVINRQLPEYFMCPVAQTGIFEAVDLKPLEVALRETVTFYKQNLPIIQNYVEREAD